MGKKLYVHFSGGLGNQLFTFASSIALSKNWSRELIIVDSWYSGYQRGFDFEEHRRDFELFEFYPIRTRFRRANWMEKKVISIIQRLYFEREINLSRVRINVVDGDNVDLGALSASTQLIYGYMQKPHIFAPIQAEIRELIRLPAHKQLEAKQKIEYYRSKGKRLIALHVRRGDYAHPDSFGCLLTPEYFKNALLHFDMSNSTVLVFSDSPEWCKFNKFLGQFQIVEEKSASVSLVMMSLCDDFIVSASTFSWWGAWLNEDKNKRVVAPLPYHEFDSTVWEHLADPSWEREFSIFESQDKAN